jgi:hypothetical protein
MDRRLVTDFLVRVAVDLAHDFTADEIEELATETVGGPATPMPELNLVEQALYRVLSSRWGSGLAPQGVSPQ